MTADPIDDQLDAMIRDTGWAVVAVGEGPGGPPFAYTVGLTVAAYPELVISGLPVPLMHTLLNQLAGRVIDRCAAFGHGEELRDVIGGGLVAVMVGGTAWPDSKVTLALAAGRYGYPLRAQQMVWPDLDDRYPWEVGYDHRGAPQVVIPHLSFPPVGEDE